MDWFDIDRGIICSSFSSPLVKTLRNVKQNPSSCARSVRNERITRRTMIDPQIKTTLNSPILLKVVLNLVAFNLQCGMGNTLIQFWIFNVYTWTTWSSLANDGLFPLSSMSPRLGHNQFPLECWTIKKTTDKLHFLWSLGLSSSQWTKAIVPFANAS